MQKELENEFGQKAIFVKVNIADRAEFEEAFKETVKIFGNLDVVINAAGILDDSQWEKEISINIGISKEAFIYVGFSPIFKSTNIFTLGKNRFSVKNVAKNSCIRGI